MRKIFGKYWVERSFLLTLTIFSLTVNVLQQRHVKWYVGPLFTSIIFLSVPKVIPYCEELGKKQGDHLCDWLDKQREE
jgi:hypothetical protein